MRFASKLAFSLLAVGVVAGGCQVVAGLNSLEPGALGGGGAGGDAGAGGTPMGTPSGTEGGGGTGGTGGAEGGGGTGGACAGLACDTYACDEVNGVCFTTCNPMNGNAQCAEGLFCEINETCGACGMDPPIAAVCDDGMSGPCGMAGGTCDGSNACVIDCVNNDCSGAMGNPATIAMAGMSPLVLNCGGTNCDHTVVTCMSPFSCTVNCTTTAADCLNMDITCDMAGPCYLNCQDGGSCKMVDMTCGANTCAVGCMGVSVNPDMNGCAESCDCQTCS